MEGNAKASFNILSANSCTHRSILMSRFRRRILQRQRQVNDACRLLRRKKEAYKQWQANQIKIWESMNFTALKEESRLKKLSEPIDKID